jgi:hypothetical protein
MLIISGYGQFRVDAVLERLENIADQWEFYHQSDPDLVYQLMYSAYDARIMVDYSLYAAPRPAMSLNIRNLKQVSLKLSIFVTCC